MKRALCIILAVFACALTTACHLNCDMGNGGGGSGGSGSTSATSTTGTGPCHPAQDNDPVVCAANHCTTVPDGCGGEIWCDTLCTTSPTPASCGMPKGVPGCVPCIADPTQDDVCANDVGRTHAYVCEWQYPQPAACIAKSTDGKNYLACCGGSAM